MFISVPRPREDAALSWTDAGFFATAAATTATFTDWEQPWNLDEFAAAQLLYGQRLREMASASQPQPSGWARLKPKRQSKKHQQQRRPHQSRQHTQQQECTVTEDPFHALQLGGAGLGGNFLHQWQNHIEEGFAPPANQPQLPSQTSYDAALLPDGYLADQALLKSEPSRWQPLSAPAPDCHSFAQLPDDSPWQPDLHDANAAMRGYPLLDFDDYPDGLSPTPFGLGQSSPQSNMGTSLPTQPTTGFSSSSSNTGFSFGSFSSNGASDLLEAMVLSDEPSPSPWLVLPSNSLTTGMTGSRGPPSHIQAASWDTEQQHSLHPSTVSPKLLRLHPSPTPTPSASTESIVTAYINATHDAEMAASFTETGQPTSAAGAGDIAAQSAFSRGRTRLPDGPRSQHRMLPALRSNNVTKAHGPTTIDSGTGKSNSRKPSHRYHEEPPRPSTPPAACKRRPSTKHDLRFTPAVDYSVLSSSPSSPDPAGAPLSPSPTPPTFRKPSRVVQGRSAGGTKAPEASPDSSDDDDGPRGGFATRRDANQFLIQSRESGMTYRDIRIQGGFVEAESTLRGRYRTLTKRREERVRKPEWSETDLHLLEIAVRSLARPATGPFSRHGPGSRVPLTGVNLETAKIPWKQVAEYIANNGGTYHFGNSTCRKKWDELRARQLATGSELGGDLFGRNPNVDVNMM